MRASSTKGKHIVLQTPALAKGLACSRCKDRKVRCDSIKPTCGACRRAAKFAHQDPSTVAACCYLPSKKAGPRRRKSTGDSTPATSPVTADFPSHEQQQQQQQASTSALQPPAPAEPLPELPHPAMSTAWTMMSDLLRANSNSSISSAKPPSLSSSRCSTRQGSPSSPKPYTAYSVPNGAFPSYNPIRCQSPLPLDSSAYFSAVNELPAALASTQLAAPPVVYGQPYSMPMPMPLAPLPPAMFPLPALPTLVSAPKLAPPPAAPSYFDLPPLDPQQQLWSDQSFGAGGLDFGWGVGVGAGAGPITPGAFDWAQDSAGARPVF